MFIQVTRHHNIKIISFLFYRSMVDIQLRRAAMIIIAKCASISPHTPSTPRLRRHPASLGVVLLDIKGGIGIVSQSLCRFRYISQESERSIAGGRVKYGADISVGDVSPLVERRSAVAAHSSLADRSVRRDGFRRLCRAVQRTRRYRRLQRCRHAPVIYRRFLSPTCIVSVTTKSSQPFRFAVHLIQACQHALQTKTDSK